MFLHILILASSLPLTLLKGKLIFFLGVFKDYHAMTWKSFLCEPTMYAFKELFRGIFPLQ